MSRITIDDLPLHEELSSQQCKGIFGGYSFSGSTSFENPIIAFESPLSAFENPIIATDTSKTGFENPIIAFESPLSA